MDLYIKEKVPIYIYILFNVLDFLERSVAPIFRIAIIPARTTEAEAPETNIKTTIDTSII